MLGRAFSAESGRAGRARSAARAIAAGRLDGPATPEVPEVLRPELREKIVVVQGDRATRSSAHWRWRRLMSGANSDARPRSGDMNSVGRSSEHSAMNVTPDFERQAQRIVDQHVGAGAIRGRR
jgi:hypothetical protein